MKLRTLVIALLLANFGYFAWTQGWVDAAIGLDAAQREPKRIAQQIAPDAIELILSAPAAAQTAANCVAKQERWLVYMGPYKKLDLDKKKAELLNLKVRATEVSKPTLPLGLSLGEFETERAAVAAKEALIPAGIKTANVVLWSTKSNCP